MPEYKLRYFPGRGLAEATRMLFAIADIPYEDIRITRDQWFSGDDRKQPFGFLPVLEVDGHEIFQSNAIARYVARIIGHAGKTTLEEALVDGLADQYFDYYRDVKPYYLPAHGIWPEPQQEVDRKRKEILIPARDRFFKGLTKILKKNGTGFLVGNDLTFIDLIIADHVYTYQIVFPEYTEGFPEIDAHQKKIYALPGLQKWLKERPDSLF